MRVPVMEAVVNILDAEGVDYAFGIPGAAILPLYHAMRTSRIKHLTVRHEEGATHAADGYARATGKVGIAIGTSGPAGTNMITGLYTAMADSIPIICITGQAQRTVLHKEAFQAVDIVEIARPVTKWSVRVQEAAQMPWVFRRAFQVAREGRPGPVLIDLPIDVQRTDIDYDLIESLPVSRPAPAAGWVKRALDMLMDAERPIIVAGGGVIISEASEELAELAEHLQVPVSPTLMGKGAIGDDHPLYAGIVGIQTQQRYANAFFLESDLVMAVGARFADRHTGALDVYRGDRKFIQIDIEPTQIGKVFEVDFGLVGDAKLTLAAMLEEARRRQREPSPPGAWVERLAELKRALVRPMDFDDHPIKPARAFKEINDFFSRDTIFVTAIGLYQIWSGQFQTTYKPRHYMVCGQAGPLGWEVPACIGVKLGRPDEEVVAIVGDYSFQFLVEEVAVAAQYNVPFLIVMLNNSNLGLIRQSELPYSMEYAIDLAYDAGLGEEAGIDHVKMMEAMGCAGRRVEHAEDIGEALAWGRRAVEETKRPVLVEIRIERRANAAMGPSIDNITEFDRLEPAGVDHELLPADVG
ncbi:MAG: glyoxylate carboligase [Candidatus Dormibacteraeota bacterium]|nr:glyoxylate carboligase [Candidatus Dormibacteraeota bacterium]